MKNKKLRSVAVGTIVFCIWVWGKWRNRWRKGTKPLTERYWDFVVWNGAIERSGVSMMHGVNIMTWYEMIWTSQPNYSWKNWRNMPIYACIYVQFIFMAKRIAIFKRI